MVEAELSDFNRFGNQVVNPPSDRTSNSVTEPIHGDSLYQDDFDPYDDFEENHEIESLQRGAARPSYDTATPRSLLSGMTIADSISRNDSALPDNQNAPPSSKQWLYGGPNNELEEYHKHYLPIFPYSETFHMEDWVLEELQREPWNRATKDPIMDSAVEYSKADDLQNDSYDRVYESGSRFTLPRIKKRTLEFLPEFLDNAVADFNNGDAEAKKKKDYAPRIFLEKIKVRPNRSTSQKQKQTVKPHLDLSTRNRPTASKPVRQTTNPSSVHVPSKSSGRRPPPLKVMVLPKKVAPRLDPHSTLRLRTRKNGDQIGYSRGEPTTPTPLITRSKRKTVESKFQSPGKRVKTTTREAEFSTKVHYYDSDESYTDSSTSSYSTNTAVSNAKGTAKAMTTAKTMSNSALMKKTKTLHSSAMGTVNRKGNVSKAADGHDIPKRGSTRSGLKFRK